MKRIRFFAAGLFLPAITILTPGCKTTDATHSGYLASVEISGHSQTEISDATKTVFLARGYEQKSPLVFEKKGSLWETVAFTDWEMDAIWTRVKVNIEPTFTGDYILGCDAYTVSDHNDALMESEQKNSYLGRTRCKEILDEIKSDLDSTNTDFVATPNL